MVHLWLRGVRDDERCGCGAAFSGCPFWQRVGQQAFGGWDRVDLARVTRLRARVDRSRFLPLLASARLRRRLQPSLGEYAAYYRRTYAAVAAVSGRPVVIDSSKHVSLAFCLSGVAGLDLRVVQVVRDSRAVAYSWRQIVRRPEAAGSQMSTYPAASAAMRWDVQNGAVDRLRRLGVPTLRVRYEDFIADPALVLDRIAAFCGLAAGADQACLGTDGGGQWWADLGPAHTVSGNPMRFRTGRIPIRSDDRWRDAMRVADRCLVTALTLPLLARYGYLRVPRPAGSRPDGVTAARRGPA